MHSEMWWPRLFAGGPAVEWDDYEKDYSDLPAPVLAAHQACPQAPAPSFPQAWMLYTMHQKLALCHASVSAGNYTIPPV